VFSTHIERYTVKKIIATLLSSLLVLSFVATSNAIAGEKRGKIVYDLPMTHMAVEKSTRVSAPYCFGTYVSDFYEPGTNERLAILAVPAFCGSSWSYFGNFGNEKRMVQAEDVIFHLVGTNADVHSGEIAFEAEPGVEVLVADYRQLSFSFHETKVTASPSGVFLSGNIAGTAVVSQTVQNCTASGCAENGVAYRDGYLIIDREWGVYPGTAVLNADNQVVGIVLGADSGRTLVMGTSRIFSLMGMAGLGGKG
jgi:hypothetical protein